MSTIIKLFEQAELAEAAYANFLSNSGVLLTSDIDGMAGCRHHACSAIGFEDSDTLLAAIVWPPLCDSANGGVRA